eukprot:m.81458 g.81458  ORF g.81458 m.81458 type:complete len:461 (+) comp25420_c0_seq1:117-1499(+)
MRVTMFDKGWLFLIQVVLMSRLAFAVLTLTSTIPNATELQAQVDAAIINHDAEFVIPPGEYNFTANNFNIANAQDLRIVGDGVLLWFGGTSGVNISNCDRVNVSGLAINYYNPVHGRRGVPGITYNLLNSSDVISEDITIFKAPFFSVTAFNGGGGHVFRRFYLPNDTAVDPTGKPTDPFPHQRDTFHFTDLRRGVTLEDSYAAAFGDDFFNSHNTLMLVLEKDSPTSLLMINPHVQNVQKGRNTVYGTNCVLENLRLGDSMHFFGFPSADFIPKPLSGSCVVQANPDQITNVSVLAQAKALAAVISKNYSTVGFDASDVWRVRFSAPLPTSVVAGSLVNIDSFSTPGTVIRNNTFIKTRYNLGRFKSNGGSIINNTFSGAGVQNLEITPLLQYFEGNLPYVRDVTVSGNTINGEGLHPIHCSAFCSNTCPPFTCAKCADCAHDSPWAVNVSVVDNHITP